MDRGNSTSASSLEEILKTNEKNIARHEKLLKIVMQHLQLQPERDASVWMPSKRSPSLVEDFASSRLKKVEIGKSIQHGAVGRLRTTWLGRVYASHLKQYSAVRWIAKTVWRHAYPVYANNIDARLFNAKNKRWRSLTRLSEFAKKRKLPTYKLVDAAIVGTLKPRVFPAYDQGYLKSFDDGQRFPEIFVAEINEALTYGETNLVLADDEVICHDLYDFARDYTSEELHGRTVVNKKSSHIRWLLHDETPESIPVAATFVDACASNYAHWITEVLPRIVLFCTDGRFHDIPIVVNNGLHNNIMESLLLAAGTDRKIITLPLGRALAVKKLYLTSAAGYVPFGRRTNKLPGYSHGIFSPMAFEALRDLLVTLVQREDESWPEKIFLRRNSGARQVTNAAEIEKLLATRGYAIVEPEKLTFRQQILLFNNAKEIISSTGAALANAIACKPGTQVAVLMSKHEDMIYRYWTNLLSPAGIKVSYVLGNIIRNHDRGIHSDFLVDLADLNNLLEDFEKQCH